MIITSPRFQTNVVIFYRENAYRFSNSRFKFPPYYSSTTYFFIFSPWYRFSLFLSFLSSRLLRSAFFCVFDRLGYSLDTTSRAERFLARGREIRLCLRLCKTRWIVSFSSLIVRATDCSYRVERHVYSLVCGIDFIARLNDWIVIPRLVIDGLLLWKNGRSFWPHTVCFQERNNRNAPGNLTTIISPDFNHCFRRFTRRSGDHSMRLAFSFSFKVVIFLKTQ